MHKLKDCFDQETLSKLQDMRDNTPPVINLGKMPRQDRFIQIRVRRYGDDFWPSVVGRACDIRVRQRKSFEAQLVSCTWKTVKALTKEDAVAAGYTGRYPGAPLIDLKAHLKKKKSWLNDDTELEILSFRMV